MPVPATTAGSDAICSPHGTGGGGVLGAGVGALAPVGGGAGGVRVEPRCTIPTAVFSLPMSTLTIWRSTPGSAFTFFTSSSVM